MCRVLASLILCLPLAAQMVEGVVKDGDLPLAGVRVYVDTPRRVLAAGPLAVVSDAQGVFRLPVPGGKGVLVVEKEGWLRDFVPVSGYQAALKVQLRPDSGFRRDRVLVVRLSMPGIASLRSEEELREVLFGTGPAVSSASAYVSEATRGRLRLQAGGTVNLTYPARLPREVDHARERITAWVLEQLRMRDLRPFDWVDNRTGLPGPDGKPDHLWIIAPGACRTITDNPAHFYVRSTLMPLPWQKAERWPVVFLTEETPVGTLVHELLHAQGEHSVDDYYLPDAADTAGRWDPMDAGQLTGWERSHPDQGPWLQDTATSPALPMAYTLGECWYRGAFRDLVTVEELKSGAWEGWIVPLIRAPEAGVQALRVADPRKPGRFWELSVRRSWGFDAGRTGDRPVPEGLVVARIDPSLLTTDGDSRGPVRVVDARPGTKEPPKPRYPGGRWELDDAAFQLGGVASGEDGPLYWHVLGEDAQGRIKVRVEVGDVSAEKPITSRRTGRRKR